MNTRGWMIGWCLVALGAGAAGCEAGTESIDGVGNRCSVREPCEIGLVCFRTVCVPDDGQPLPSSTPTPSPSDLPLPTPGPTPEPTPGPTPTPTTPPEVLFAGTAAPLAVYASGAELLVVDVDGVRRLDADGKLIDELETGRPITAAAFDGEVLAIADRAFVTALTPALAILTTTEIPRYCASAVIVDAHRFVCGPENDWDRVFTTIDLDTGTIVGESMPYTYNGIPMRRVPGTSDFVTVTTGSSPSDFHLYELGARGEAVFVNESPYHGDIVATDVYAFDGTPATHVINSVGTMLRIRGAGCVSGNSFTSECFVRDGDLGVLPVGAFYAAMTDDGAGRVFTVRGSGSGSFFDAICTADAACIIEQVDVSRRALVERITYRQPVAALHSVVFQATPRRLVLVVPRAADRFEPPVGYDLRSVPLQP